MLDFGFLGMCFHCKRLALIGIEERHAEDIETKNRRKEELFLTSSKMERGLGPRAEIATFSALHISSDRVLLLGACTV